MFPNAVQDVILFKDIAIDQENVFVNLDTMGKSAINASLYLAVNMAIAMLVSNVFVVKDGMEFSALSVSITFNSPLCPYSQNAITLHYSDGEKLIVFEKSYITTN